MKIKTIMKISLKKMLSLEVKEIETKEGVLYYDGETITEGMEVFIKEDEEFIVAPDGNYTTETDVITVAEGKITVITPIETQEEVVEEVAAAEVVEEPAAEPAETTEVEETVTMEQLKTQVDDLVKAITEITNTLAALKGAYDELVEKVNKLETEPAAEPIENETEEPVKASRISYLRK